MKDLTQYLEQNYKSPEDYVISKFGDHDIVFLGEMHRVKHDVELIHRLIPCLHKNGIFTLAIEFARQTEQQLIDRLVTAEEYDEQLAQLVLFRKFPFWGYQEYADIFKAAWKFNRSLPDKDRKFRILGISDSPDWSHVKNEGDRAEKAIMQKVFKGQGEKLWADCLMREVVSVGDKALVYSGLHHAFTGYKQPVVVNGQFRGFNEDRCGRYIYNEIGKRAMTISLHSPWLNADFEESIRMVKPVNGVIDNVMESIDLPTQGVGFDIFGTPFENLPCGDCLYQYGYDKLTLGMFCEGYIYQKPFDMYEPVTPINDFINESNIEEAREQSPSPSFKQASIEQFNKAITLDHNMSKYMQK